MSAISVCCPVALVGFKSTRVDLTTMEYDLIPSIATKRDVTTEKIRMTDDVGVSPSLVMLELVPWFSVPAPSMKYICS